MSYPVLQTHLDPSNKVLDYPPTVFIWDRFYCCCDCCLPIWDIRGLVIINPVFKVFPKVKILWCLSPVNAATPPSQTCGYSVCQENAVAAMPMIRLRCGDGTILLEPLEVSEDPPSSTKCCHHLPST